MVKDSLCTYNQYNFFLERNALFNFELFLITKKQCTKKIKNLYQFLATLNALSFSFFVIFKIVKHTNYKTFVYLVYVIIFKIFFIIEF